MMMAMMQPEPKNKEQFKLLQYSDDSKSLSDLELAEIVVPRKRKVRRKTKPKNGHRHRKQSSDGSGSSSCHNIRLWVAIISNVGWLLLLSYVVSVVHSEFGQLAKEQSKLAATLKTLPDEWHDKAHNLEVNQSTLFHSLFDLQQSMKNLTDDFLQLRAIVQQQQLQATDVARVAFLEKSVAEFGAALKSVNSEIELLKNRSAKFGEAITRNTDAVEYFRGIVLQRRLNETSVDGGPGVTEMEKSFKDDVEGVRNATLSLERRLDQVNSSFTSFAATETQKVDELEKSHAKKINDLGDSVANITAQDVNQAMKNYQDKIAGLETRLNGLEKRAEVWQQQQQEQERKNKAQEGLNAALQRLQANGKESANEEVKEGGEGGVATSGQEKKE